MNMKICILIGEFNIFSGTSKPMFELAKGLLRKGHDVTIITSKLKSNLKNSHDEFFEKDENRDIKIIEVSTNLYGYTIKGYKKDHKIIDIIAESDVLHGFNFIELYLMKRLMNKLKIQTKTICTISGPYKFYFKDLWDSGIFAFLNLIKPSFIFKLLIQNRFLKKIFRNFDKIITNTDFMASEIKNIGVDPKKVKKIEASVDIDKINEAKDLEIKKIYDFIYFGSGSSIRGVQDVLKAFDIVLKHRKDSTLAFYLLGSHGIEENIYSNIIRHNKNFESSIFLNVGAKLDILKIIKSSNAVVLPFRSSIGYSHPPLTIIESLLLEQVVISTDVGSIPEFIQDGITGYLVTKGNINEIAEKMLLSFDMNVKLKIGRNARMSITETHEIDHIIDETIKIYENVLSE